MMVFNMDKEFNYVSSTYSAKVVIDVSCIPVGFNYEPSLSIEFRYVYDENGKQPVNFKTMCIEYVRSELNYSNADGVIPDYVVEE